MATELSYKKMRASLRKFQFANNFRPKLSIIIFFGLTLLFPISSKSANLAKTSSAEQDEAKMRTQFSSPTSSAEQDEAKMRTQFSSPTSSAEQDEAKMRTQFSSPTSSVVLNEILPSPEGEDAKEEWIELFNTETNAVDLSGWEIADTQGSVKSYVFPEGSQILGKGFFLLERPKTKITLNNDADGLQLIRKGIILDSVQYTKSPTGQSFNRSQSGWVWSKTLTPGSINIITPSGLREDKSKRKIEQTEKKNPSEVQKQTADIGGKISKNKLPFQLFFLALGLAIFSGATMLFLKKQPNNN